MHTHYNTIHKLQRSMKSGGGAPAPGAPLLPTPLYSILIVYYGILQ